MDSTTKAPNVPLAQSKRTKIIATVGPATNSYDAILDLVKSGANGLRLNFSHGTHEERSKQIKWIRKASKEYGKPVAIIQDLQGPKIRLGDFDGIVNVAKDQNFRFGYKADYQEDGVLPTQYDLSKKIKRGERMLIYDGKVKMTVTSVKDGLIHAQAENSGILIQRKGINLPDTDLAGDILTKKDQKDLSFGSHQDIDYVALSFVQHSDDIAQLRKKLTNLGSKARIIAKIETKSAVDNLEDIIKEADSVMIARGDLATETSPESVPIVQRQIIGLGIRHARPTIVATQMLATMTELPEPTRAEVSDVATAVIIGADSVMLSDETANGRYPIEAVKVMKKVILHTQQNMPLKVTFPDSENESTKASAIATAIIEMAENLNAKAIVAETKSGATALKISSRRPERTIIAVTSDTRVAQQLAIVYGLKSYIRPDDAKAALKLTNWLHKERVLKKGDMVITASGRYPGVVGTTDTIKVRVID